MMILLGLVGFILVPVGLFSGELALAGLGVVLVIFFFIHAVKVTNENKANTKAKVLKILEEANFNSDHSFISDDSSTVLALCEEKKEILMIDVKTVDSVYISHTVKTINFKELIEVKVNQNSKEIRSSSRSIGGAIVGGVLFGGVGAVIGGLGGETETSQSIRELKLELVINSIESPVFEVNFYNGADPIPPQHPDYNGLIKNVNEWYRKCGVIIHQN